jgi:hypothetical protein
MPVAGVLPVLDVAWKSAHDKDVVGIGLAVERGEVNAAPASETGTGGTCLTES